jgi:ubiquinone biosynthesis monooxygenase Coq6
VSGARIEFSASELGTGDPESASMSLMTENINLQSALLHHLSGIQDIEILDKTKVVSIEKDHREGGHWPTVHLSDGRMLRTRLLVIRSQVVFSP